MEFLAGLGYAIVVFMILLAGFSIGSSYAEEEAKKQAEQNSGIDFSNGYLTGAMQTSEILGSIISEKEKTVVKLFDELKKKDKLIKDLTDDSKKA